VRALRAGRVFAALALLTACAVRAPAPTPEAPAPAARFADRIYVGGPILTMEGDAPEYAEALATRDGRIAFVGTRADAEKLAGPDTRVVDLRGRALVPGFVAPQGDLFATGFAELAADLRPPLEGYVSSVTGLTRALYAWSKTDAAQKLGWIVGTGFDETRLRERRAPTADELDEVSRTLPVVAIRWDGRAAALNSVARKLAGLGSKAAPRGLATGADFDAVAAALPSFDAADEIARAQAVYASHGFTTAEETGASRGRLAALAAAAESGKLFLDVRAYADVSSDALDVVSSRYRSKSYASHFRIAGWALELAGPADASFDAKLDEAAALKEQLVVRCDGAAALEALASALRETNADDRRPIAVVPAGARREQLDALRALGTVVRTSAPPALRHVLARESASSYATLRALTLEAARAAFEDDDRGSLRVGKRADLAILSADPVAKPVPLARLVVLETVKDGKTISESSYAPGGTTSSNEITRTTVSK